MKKIIGLKQTTIGKGLQMIIIRDENSDGQIVQVISLTHTEAINVINSLTNQILIKGSRRGEWNPINKKTEEYLSIAVLTDKEMNSLRDVQ